MLQRLIAYVVLVPVAVVIVALSVANRNLVILSLDPINTEPLFYVEGPFFLFLFAAFALGGVVASAITWLRQGRWRKRARVEIARADRLQQEIERLQEKTRPATPLTSPSTGLPQIERGSSA